MNQYDKNKVVLYLTAVHNDLKTYLDNPHEFDAEFFEDIEEAIVSQWIADGYDDVVLAERED